MPLLKTILTSIFSIVILNLYSQGSYFIASDETKTNALYIHEGLFSRNTEIQLLIGNEPFTLKNKQLCGQNENCYTFKPGTFNPSLSRIITGNSINGGILYDLNSSTLEARGFSEKFKLIKSNINQLTIKHSKLSLITLDGDTIQSYELISDTLESLTILQTGIKKLWLLSCKIEKLTISSFQPDTLILNNVQPSRAPLDFTEFSRPFNNQCVLKIDIESVQNVKFNYSNYRLQTSLDQSSQTQHEIDIDQTLYLAIIDQQKKFGFTDGEEKITKEYRKFKYIKDKKVSGYFFNWLEKYLWDYGYHKGLIIQNTAWLFLSFFLLNLLCYNKLVHQVYPIGQFVSHDIRKMEKSGKWATLYFVYCLLYTAFVFFRITLNFDSLSIKRLGLTFYILIQSLIGTACLALIIAYFFTK